MLSLVTKTVMLGPVTEPDLGTPLSRTASSAAVQDIGWRYLLATLAVTIPVRSLAQASEVAAAAVAASGADAEGNEVCVCTWTDRDEYGK